MWPLNETENDKKPPKTIGKLSRQKIVGRLEKRAEANELVSEHRLSPTIFPS
jgi:hypothetical protein